MSRLHVCHILTIGCSVSKWRPKIQIAPNSIFGRKNSHEKIKNCFSKEIWLTEAEHKYNYIAEITFEKKLFRYDFRDKTMAPSFGLFILIISKNNAKYVQPLLKQ